MTREILEKANDMIYDIECVHKVISNYHNLSIRFYSKAKLFEIPSELKAKISETIEPLIKDYYEELNKKFKELTDNSDVEEPEPETENQETETDIPVVEDNSDNENEEPESENNSDTENSDNLDVENEKEENSDITDTTGDISDVTDDISDIKDNGEVEESIENEIKGSEIDSEIKELAQELADLNNSV